MKITKAQLKRIIKEEIKKLQESRYRDGDHKDSHGYLLRNDEEEDYIEKDRRSTDPEVKGYKEDNEIYGVPRDDNDRFSSRRGKSKRDRAKTKAQYDHYDSLEYDDVL